MTIPVQRLSATGSDLVLFTNRRIEPSKGDYGTCRRALVIRCQWPLSALLHSCRQRLKRGRSSLAAWIPLSRLIANGSAKTRRARMRLTTS
jgi:hypothetical protein